MVRRKRASNQGVDEPRCPLLSSFPPSPLPTQGRAFRVQAPGITRTLAKEHIMDIQKLSEIFASRTAKYFRLAGTARTQAQIDAATRAQSSAARAGVRLDAAKVAL